MEKRYFHIAEEVYRDRVARGLDIFNFIIPRYGIIYSVLKESGLVEWELISRNFIEGLKAGFNRFVNHRSVDYIQLNEATLEYLKTIYGSRLARRFKTCVFQSKIYAYRHILDKLDRSSVIYLLPTNDFIYSKLVKELGYPYIEVPTIDGYNPDLDFLESNMVEESLIIYTIPSMPYGKVDLNELNRILELSREYNSIVLIEDTYIELIFQVKDGIQYDKDVKTSLLNRISDILDKFHTQVILIHSIPDSFFTLEPNITILSMSEAISSRGIGSCIDNYLVSQLEADITYETLYRITVIRDELHNVLGSIASRRFADLTRHLNMYMRVPSEIYGGHYIILEVEHDAHEIFNRCINEGVLTLPTREYIPNGRGVIISLLTAPYDLNDSIWRTGLERLVKCLKSI